MKNLLAISKKGIILVSAVFITIAGLMLAVLPSVYAGHGGQDGSGGGSRGYGCGGRHQAGSDEVYVKIPIVNNHYPKGVTISEVKISVPGECVYEPRGPGENAPSYWYDTKIVREIKFGDTTVFSDTGGLCTCENHPVTFTVDDPDEDSYDGYKFSTTDVVCRVRLDWDNVPTGLYIITYYYRLPGDTTDREQELTFSLP